jgi:27-O-demethylrifamycin SV methyltransferase
VTDPGTTDGHSYSPSTHYDNVTAAWTLLLGDELHYGVFETGEESLPAATGELTRRMIEASAFEPGMSVLDVGCGTGSQACRLATEEGLDVTGITTSAVGLKAARARAAGAGVVARFELRDGMDNGYADASFDRVWVLESSHLMRRRDRLLSECARVLPAGGRLALCDIVLRSELPFAEVRRLREPLSLLREVFGDARMETLARYADLAADGGLAVDTRTDLTALTRPTFARWRENAERHQAAVAATLGDDGLQRFVDAVGVMERCWDEGVLGYGLLAASKR